MLGHTLKNKNGFCDYLATGFKGKKILTRVGFWLLSCFFCSFLMANSSAFAQSTLTLNIDSNSLVLNLLPSKVNGTFASSNNLTVDVSVRGPEGYTLGIKSTSSTNLVKQGDNTKMLSSISSAVSGTDFAADTTTAASNYNGKWGYLPTKLDSSANTLYQPAPNTTGDTLDVTHGMNEEGEYGIAIGARASLDAAPGIYTNTFTITAVSNYVCSVGEVCYNDNEADGGSMEDQIIPSGETEVELDGLGYYRSGYGFAGWSPTMLDPDDADFASDLAAATVYGPNETVEVPAAGYLELYAVWVPSSGNMQSWNGCNSLSTGEVIGLTDTRDGNVYAVSKLADGKCWQIENLRLDFSDENVELTNMNTNHATAQFMSDANKHPEPTDGFVRSYNDMYSTAVQYHTKYSNENYVRGIYYSYYTFRGGTRQFGESYSVKGDICPAGWYLSGDKRSGGSNSYASLIDELTGADPNKDFYNATTNPTSYEIVDALLQFPNNFVMNGFVSSPSSDYLDHATFYSGMFYPTDSYEDSYSSTHVYYFLGMFRSGAAFYKENYFTGNLEDEGYSFRCISNSSDNNIYTLSYDAVGGTNAPVSETSSNGIFLNITTDEPTRNGYTFIGWVDDAGIEVEPGGNYNAGTKTIDSTLYAIWSNNSCNNTATTIGTGNSTDAVCMQDMNGAVKAAMTNANTAAGSIQTFQLIDARDNQSYDIALLDDGNVWMTKNLNLGRNGNIALTHYDTNLPSMKSFVIRTPNTYNYYNGDTYDGYYDGIYYGGYYTWKIATASGYSNKYVMNRSTSICPSGWILPPDYRLGNLATVASLTNNTSASVAPYNFSSGGLAKLGTTLSFVNRGSVGYYWSSTGSNYNTGNYAYVLKFTSSANQFSNISITGDAANIRCMKNEGFVTINYYGNGDNTYPVVGSDTSSIVSLDTGNVQTNSFSRDGYKFRTWNTESDGSGIDVDARSNVYALNLSDGDEISLYAQWNPQLIITYDDNYSGLTFVRGGIGPGSSATLGSYKQFTTKTGYSIKEWNTEPDGSGTTYAVNSSFTAPANMTEPTYITLYAQWIEDYVITFVDTESGSTQTKNIAWSKSGTITPSTAWTYTGYKLIGWDTVANSGLNSNSGTVVYTDGQSVTPTNNMTVYTVWAPLATIQYDGNGATGGATMSVTHTIGQGEEFTLYPSNYSKTGFGFAGWSFDPNAADDLANATVYGPSSMISISSITPGETKILYAVWVEAESNVTMQTFDSTAQPYASADEGTVIALTDSRDSDTYTVAKLADGKWWMIENMRLGGTTYMTLNNTTSSIASASFYLPGSSSSFSRNNSNEVQISTVSKTSTVSSMADTNSNVYSYGNYYSWNAAIGDTQSKTTQTVTTSICPIGWHLPIGGDSGEFANLSLELGGLVSSMNSNTVPTGDTISRAFRAFPNNFVYSGYHNSGTTFQSRGTMGRYWSSTSYSSNYAYNFYITDTNVNPNHYSNSDKYLGYSIRCIANDN